MLTNPVPNLNVVRMRVFCKSCRLSLLRGEVALFLFGKIEQATRCFLTSLSHGHNTTTNLKYCATPFLGDQYLTTSHTSSRDLCKMLKPQFFQDDRAHRCASRPASEWSKKE